LLFCYDFFLLDPALLLLLEDEGLLLLSDPRLFIFFKTLVFFGLEIGSSSRRPDWPV
jgi:hypothetical protein